MIKQKRKIHKILCTFCSGTGYLLREPSKGLSRRMTDCHVCNGTGMEEVIDDRRLSGEERR